MAKIKKKPTPKKIKTLIPEPNWDKLRKSNSQEKMFEAYKLCDDYVQFEVSDKEYLHWMKKWLREVSGWNVHEETVILPDVYMLTYAKLGWKAIQLGFMPDSVKSNLERDFLPLLKRAKEIKSKYQPETSIKERDKDDFIHPVKVKKWLVVWKDYLKTISKNNESKDVNLRIQYQTAETYVYNMQVYLRTGIWNDLFYGENREHKVLWVCEALGYDEDGLAKRNVDTYYPDIGQIWRRDES